MAKIKINHAGERYGRLTVLREAEAPRYSWLCKCDCGNIITLRAGNLKNAKSCGCHLVEEGKRKELILRSDKICESDFKKYDPPRLKKIWYGMRDRCRRGLYRKKNIKVCKEWDESFDAFAKWSYAHGYYDPEPGANEYDALSIDRIDSSGDYEPNNCQWIRRRDNSTKRDKIITGFDPHEAAQQIIDFVIGFDDCFYSAEEKKKAVDDIEQALNHIKIIAESPHNLDYWRFFVEALKYLYN